MLPLWLDLLPLSGPLWPPLPLKFVLRMLVGIGLFDVLVYCLCSLQTLVKGLVLVCMLHPLFGIF